MAGFEKPVFSASSLALTGLGYASAKTDTYLSKVLKALGSIFSFGILR
jgi:hypothetical protein